MYSRYGIEQFAYRHIAVKCINYICNVFAHIYLLIPGTAEKLGRSVNEVCCKYLMYISVFVSFIELLHAVGEKTEGGIEEDSVRF